MARHDAWRPALRPLLSPSAPVERSDFWLSCLLAAPMAALPSVLLLLGVKSALDWAGVNTELLMPTDHTRSAYYLASAIVMAPLVETALLALLLRALSGMSANPVFVAVASALLWGALHASFGALWFFGTVWSFYVFSSSYLRWRTTSARHAFVAAALPHALLNAGVLFSDAVFG